jgi:hypothetical protein
MSTFRAELSMQAFVCVYRHSHPKDAELRKTAAAAVNDELLQEFLARYDDENNYYDWGDDPGFFAATKLLGDPRAASWGVCRRDVRCQLRPADIIIWFCAKEGKVHGAWHYYFVGFCTVAHAISREQLWLERRFTQYRKFYNVLAKLEDGVLRQKETFHDYHLDWAKRAAAPYVIFDPGDAMTRLNLENPLYVADKPPHQPLEVWHASRDHRVQKLRQALFGRLKIARGLRTTHPQMAHRHIALHNEIRRWVADPNKELRQVRSDLAELVG